MSNITVKSIIEVYIEGTTYQLTKQQAEILYSQLGAALNLNNSKQLNYPEGVRNPDISLYRQGDIVCKEEWS